MSETKHTAGPWEINGYGPFEVCNLYLISITANHPIEDDGTERTMADARLIAAAPDLLAALESFVEDVRVAYIGTQPDSALDDSALHEEWPDLCDTYFRAKAAIAKAKGGARCSTHSGTAK